jgi:hypothetical protein
VRIAAAIATPKDPTKVNIEKPWAESPSGQTPVSTGSITDMTTSRISARAQNPADRLRSCRHDQTPSPSRAATSTTLATTSAEAANMTRKSGHVSPWYQ